MQNLRTAFPNGDTPAIDVFEIGGAYFVEDGHHRVALALERQAEFIDAHVTRLDTNYQVGPDVDVSQLVHTEQQRVLLEESGLSRARPEATVEFTLLDGYTQTREIIKAHGCDLARTRGALPTPQEVAGDWYDETYLPALQAAPGASLPELYESWHSTDGDFFLRLYQIPRDLRALDSSVDFEAAARHARQLHLGWRRKREHLRNADDLCLVVIDDMTGYLRVSTRLNYLREKFLLSARRSYHKSLPWRGVAMMPLVRRSLAVLIAALLAGVLVAAGISVPANAAPKGSLEIVSVTDTASELGAPVKNRPFNVAVRVLDNAGQPMTVNQATTIVLEEVSGPGVLGGTTTAVIPRNGSGAIISGATYNQFGNGVVLRVRAASGAQLAPDEVTVEVALTAVGADASPGRSLNLTDSTCLAPTTEVPNCGQLLLPNGASGHVTLSVGSCDGLGPCRTGDGTEALVVTGIAKLKDAQGNPLYSNLQPATLVVACDKDLCRETANGVPSVQVIYTLDNTSDLDKTAPPCPAKGILGDRQEACVDYVQSKRSQGDLYMYLLFNIDARASFP